MPLARGQPGHKPPPSHADVAEPLVLLEIETDLLDVRVVEELPAPDATETLPHIYGPLSPLAVVSVTPLG